MNIVNELSRELQTPREKIIPTFASGPFRGTWIHRDLATNLAAYCDNDGRLSLAVSKAIRALADRPLVPYKAATEEKAFAVRFKQAEPEERRLAVAQAHRNPASNLTAGLNMAASTFTPLTLSLSP